MAYVDLGRTYAITLPVVGKQNVDIPVDEIVRDAIDAAKTDIWERTKQNWYYFVAAGMLVGAVVMLRKARK